MDDNDTPATYLTYYSCREGSQYKVFCAIVFCKGNSLSVLQDDFTSTILQCKMSSKGLKDRRVQPSIAQEPIAQEPIAQSHHLDDAATPQEHQGVPELSAGTQQQYQRSTLPKDSTLARQFQCPAFAKAISFLDWTFIQIAVGHSHGGGEDSLPEALEFPIHPQLRAAIYRHLRMFPTCHLPALRAFATEFSIATFGAAFVDASNRYFSPSDDALSSIISRTRQACRNHPNALVATNLVISKWMADPTNAGDWIKVVSGPDGYCVVGQTKHQRQMLHRFSTWCVGLDSTHSTNLHRLSLFFIFGRDCFLQGQCLGFMLLERETTDAISTGLSEFVRSCEATFQPKFFVTDKSQAEINAIAKCFPQAIHYLCTFHVRQAWQRKLAEGSMKIKDKGRQKLLLYMMERIQDASNEQEFHRLVIQFEKHRLCPPELYTYLSSEWLCCAPMWAYYVRKDFFGGMTTNNLLESFNKVVKEKLGKSHHRLRLDELLVRLLRDVFPAHANNYVTAHMRHIHSRVACQWSNFQSFTPRARKDLIANEASAKEIISSLAISAREEAVYEVRNSSGMLDVVKLRSERACTCHGFIWSGLACVHIFAVLSHFNLKFNEMPPHISQPVHSTIDEVRTSCILC